MASTVCIRPFYKKTGEGPYACGSCPSCRLRRASDWSFRLMHEARNHELAHFLTLTYDTEHVPISPSGFMSLCKRDVQLFIKRLRKAHSAADGFFRYYAVGEYGGRTRRPHYHIIAFSATIPEIESSWGLGLTHYGSVSGASVGYTLKYITKVKSVPAHVNDDRVPEFSLMSKDLGCHISRQKLLSGISPGLDIESIVISKEEKRSLCLGITENGFIV